MLHSRNPSGLRRHCVHRALIILSWYFRTRFTACCGMQPGFGPTRRPRSSWMKSSPIATSLHASTIAQLASGWQNE